MSAPGPTRLSRGSTKQRARANTAWRWRRSTPLLATGRPLRADLFDGAPAQDRGRLCGEEIARLCVLVGHFDQEPDLLSAVSDPGQGKAALQLLPIQPDRHVAVLYRLVEWHRPALPLGDVAVGAGIPDDHPPGPILAFQDD